MALYESICLKCGKLHVYRKPIAERDDAPKCKDCNTQTVRKMITPPMGTVIGPAAG